MPATLSVIIPTQRRPEGLVRALRSLRRQTGVDLRELEVVVADNDVEPSARAAARALEGELAPIAVVYLHEPAPGVATARNAGLARAAGAWIAFLDDDEEAAPGWLAALTAAARAFEADVVFGPVVGRAPPHTPHRRYLEAFFSRTGPAADGLVARHYGCGNSLVRRAAMPHPTSPFDPAFNRRGGEDDVLFSEMRHEGRRFAWAAGATVFEDPLPERLSLRYALRRAFAHGQGATTLRAVYGPPWRVPWSILTGAGQALVYGALGLAAFAVFAPRRAFLLDRAARGLGKIFWWRPFHIAFYGLAPNKVSGAAD